MNETFLRPEETRRGSPTTVSAVRTDLGYFLRTYHGNIKREVVNPQDEKRDLRCEYSNWSEISVSKRLYEELLLDAKKERAKWSRMKKDFQKRFRICPRCNSNVLRGKHCFVCKEIKKGRMEKGTSVRIESLN